METKPLLYGLIGFFIGGLLVSVAATTFEKPKNNETVENISKTSITMADLSESLKNKSGDDFDKAFLNNMILHHEGAVDMAKLSAKNAKHDEIKNLSLEIISAQEREIAQMKNWLKNWGYFYNENPSHNSH